MMSLEQALGLFLCEFKLGFLVAEAERNINLADGQETAKRVNVT